MHVFYCSWFSMKLFIIFLQIIWLKKILIDHLLHWNFTLTITVVVVVDTQIKKYHVDLILKRTTSWFWFWKVLKYKCVCTACSRLQFRCASGQCRSYYDQCDGDCDCHDCSDEVNCSKLTSDLYPAVIITVYIMSQKTRKLWQVVVSTSMD